MRVNKQHCPTVEAAVNLTIFKGQWPTTSTFCYSDSFTCTVTNVIYNRNKFGLKKSEAKIKKGVVAGSKNP